MPGGMKSTWITGMLNKPLGNSTLVNNLLKVVGILATETILQILQLKLRVQLVGNGVTGTWLNRGLMPALLKQLNQFSAFYSATQLHFH
jgi:hypothetical protein